MTASVAAAAMSGEETSSLYLYHNNSVIYAVEAAPATDLSGLHVGSKVRHDRFGEGEIVSIEGEGGNAKATVAFDHFGQKQLLLKFAKLTVLND